MKNEDFVTYEQAIALEKMGFFDGDWSYGYFTIEDKISLERIGKSWHLPFLCPAPNLTQVQNWFFEEKKIYIEIYCTNYLNNFGYELKFDYDSNKKYCTQGFISPNEALSRGIDDAIKYIEENDYENIDETI